MRPQAAGSFTRELLASRGPVADMLCGAAGALLALVAMTAVVLCWRRLAGELGTPLAPVVLLGAGAALAAAAWAVRRMWAAAILAAPANVDRRVSAICSVALLASGAALSLSGTSSLALLFFWTVLVGEELTSWQPALGRYWRAARSERVDGTGIPPVQEQTRAGRQCYPEREVGGQTRLVRVDPAQGLMPYGLEAGIAPLPAEGVVQRLVRSQAADGVERLRGWLRVEFLPGQRTASVHVAFCPPLARTPVLTARQLDGPPGRLKTIQLLPYGARLDLKLSGAVEEATSVGVEFCAEAGPSDQPGAK